MELHELKDYYKYKLFLPICDETRELDKAVRSHENLQKARRVESRKNIADLDRSLANVKYRISVLREYLKRKQLIK
jgi:hypothetical protein